MISHKFLVGAALVIGAAVANEAEHTSCVEKLQADYEASLKEVAPQWFKDCLESSEELEQQAKCIEDQMTDEKEQELLTAFVDVPAPDLTECDEFLDMDLECLREAFRKVSEELLPDWAQDCDIRDTQCIIDAAPNPEAIGELMKKLQEADINPDIESCRLNSEDDGAAASTVDVGTEDAAEDTAEGTADEDTADDAADAADDTADAATDDSADITADATADITVDATADAAADDAADATADDAADATADDTADATADDTADATADDTADAPADDTADAPADDTADAPADDTADAPADDTADAPADDTADAPADDAADAPADDTADAPADDTADASAEIPAEGDVTDPATAPPAY